jgi:Arc/MetJ family transcription regulator
MRTTITIEDTLFDKAAKAAAESNASTLVTMALKLLVATESKKRLLKLSGTAPAFTIPDRSSRSSAAEEGSDYSSQ